MQGPSGSQDLRKYLDPRVLTRISRLEIKAKLIVEGFIAGLHRSPYRGFSVEFAEHREYVPGDDIRHVDWKVYGRSDRYYIKQYEEETNLRAHLFLDVSESMSYPEHPTPRGGSPSKLEYGSYVAASLAYLLLRQQDAVGVALFDDRVRAFVPPSSSPAHLGTVLGAIDAEKPGGRTRAGGVFQELADRLKKRCLVVVISDLFDDVDRLRLGLKHLRYRNHDVMVFHVLARDEVAFPFQRMTLFEGLEGLPSELADPAALRDAYLAELNQYLAAVRRMCRDDGIDYVQLHTEDKLDIALSAFLAARAGARRV